MAETGAKGRPRSGRSRSSTSSREKGENEAVVAATSQRFLDAAGTGVESQEAAVAAPQAGVATACLELRNGVLSFIIEVNVDPNTYPFVISGGTIKSGICGAPWNVTGGFLGTNLRIDATRQGTGSCANTIIIVGEEQFPPSWRGTYGFDGQSSSFKHSTLFHSWNPCPS